MTTYSYSKISTFLQCRYKYKLQYIDRIKVEVKTTIEAFMGSIVHQTLEKLYKDMKFGKNNNKKELLSFYSALWDEKYSDDIRIVKKEYSAQNYKDMGAKFVSDYYEHYAPFDQIKVLGLETQEMLNLNNGNKYHIRIDRLCSDNRGTYYVCDYKTNSRLKSQEEADSDRQLAMYALWVKERFKDAKEVKLIWYMLAFDREVSSERTDEQLKNLKKEIEEQIEKIERCEDFPVNESALCNWCNYKELCPLFRHEEELKSKKGLEKYMAEDGLKLIDELDELIFQKKQIEGKIDTIKDRLIEFAKQRKVNMIFGTDKKASVREYEKVIYPQDKEKLVNVIKEKGLYDDLSNINYIKLSSKILKSQIDEDIIKMTRIEKDYRFFLSKKK
ncbi:MAG: hypothetical protein DRN66_02085 [Candidatus Nanohalarchaeota archaeon]|nr:MAG: hypothetical protein DRN66_02085 [Candidatus Nanohaloarchaeota archaeon]